MGYTIDKKTGEITIGNFDKGIASSPHKGIGDIKALNIDSMPDEVQVSYARTQSTLTSTSGNVTFNTTNTITHTGNDVVTGQVVTISGSGDANIPDGNYYATRVSSTQIHISSNYANYLSATFVTAAGNTSATFSTLQMGQPIGWAASASSNYPNYDYFVADGNYVWYRRPSSNSSLLQQWTPLDAQSASLGITGVFCFASYLFCCESGTTNALRYKPIGSLGTIFTAFKDLNSDSSSNAPANYHFSLTSHNNVAYICDGRYIDSLGFGTAATFNPAGVSGVDYTWSSQALILPSNDNATVIAEIASGLQTTLLIGGELNILYPWDGLATTYGALIYLAEYYTAQMVTANNLVYIFCGSKGNVYITNGSSITGVLTMPDYVANNRGTNEDPYYIWGGAMYLRGRVWFGVKAANCGGIWSFDPTINYFIQQDTGAALRMDFQNSYGTYNGYATVLFPLLGRTAQNTNGPQFFSGWDNGSSTYGMDFSSSNAFTGGSIIETDLIPTGTILNKATFNQVEYKLSTPLAANESVQLYYRFNLSDSFTSCGTVITESTATNSTDNGGTQPLSGYFKVNFQNTQWLQIKAVLTAVSSNSSFVRLKNIFIR